MNEAYEEFVYALTEPTNNHTHSLCIVMICCMLILTIAFSALIQYKDVILSV